MHIVHLTSVHPRDDIRIFYKECRSLVTGGYAVTLLVADGLGDSVREGVKIIDVGHEKGRVRRILRTTSRMLSKAKELGADVYHLHDPELIPVGLRLKRLGKFVVFDAHEDVPKQLLGKPYLTPFVLKLLSMSFTIFERYACSRFDGILAATPSIRDKFLEINANTIDVNNYPLIGELDATEPWSTKTREVCYVGNIAGLRGIREMVQAINLVSEPAVLTLVGRFTEPVIESEVKTYKGWGRVTALGVCDRQGVKAALDRAVAGLVTLHPAINYLDALPIKMFEYMAAGIPVIASNFPLWQKIVEDHDCGVCVDPLNPRAIAAAIDLFLENRAYAETMGLNGALAVKNYFNWGIEEKKLLAFYSRICST
jgi:glycosyltransferase involved in cell wall biosynthesis